MTPARRPTKKEAGGGFVDFQNVPEEAPPAAEKLPPVTDPAVNALLVRSERRQAEARLPHKERERKRKEREKMQARRAAHTTYDLPVALRGRIKALAEAEGIPASQLAALGLLRLVADLEAGRLELSGLKRPTKSPRFDYCLELDFGALEGQEEVQEEKGVREGKRASGGRRKA